MHHTLKIQEILLNIFGHCRLPTRESPASDLPALARTCHTFKEPALDVLWEKLVDQSSLARCLPEASHCRETLPGDKIEWGILRSYARRTRSIMNDKDTLDWESVGNFLNHPTSEPLFPNLHCLYTGRLTEIKIKHLLHMPFPSLISLDVGITHEEYLHLLQGSLESFFKFSPNIRRLSIDAPRWPDITFTNFFSAYICRWKDLQSVDCGRIALDADALAHLSHMPALTRLNCTPNATLPPADSPLLFPNLHHLTLSSEFLGPISQLLSQTRLPAITDFTVYIESYPSKERFSYFLASVQTSAVGRTIQGLRFREECGVQDGEEGVPFMAFSNLRRIYIDLGWEVDLSDRELLTLASAWPHLEQLVINEECGWDTPGGITPDGLLRLLQACRLLSDIALTIDTRGYTEFRESPASLGLSLPSTFSLDVLDSFIEEESVPAIAAFLAGIAPCPNFSFRAYKSWWFNTDRKDHEDRWYDAYNRANFTLNQHS
ncbi:hypothetical protein OG21DRAFT_1606155 [Imleria badia]|nr:hypothetical protein OG21DRAFT_1606155 [Imleria badia]